jgi:ABC-type multidrug transport system fused ATPase/permease subunit
MSPHMKPQQVTEGPINFKNGLRLITDSFKKYKGELLIITVLLLLSVLGSLFLPKAIQHAIDNNLPNKDYEGLRKTILFMIAISAVDIFSTYFRISITGKTSQKVLFNIRQKVFNKIQELPLKFFSENQSGDIIQRLTGNVEGIGNFFSQGLVRILEIFFKVSFIIAFMYVQDWRIATVVTTGGVLTFLLITFQGKFLSKPLRKMLKKEGKLSSISQEFLDGFLAIKATNREQQWSKKFEDENTEYYNFAKKTAKISSIGSSSLSFMNISTTFAIILFALPLYQSGMFTLGSLILFISYSQSLFRTMDGISSLWSNVKTGIASADRLTEILDLESNIFNSENPYKPEAMKGSVEFKDVDFSYDNGDLVLSDINFKIEEGKTVAVIGPTGAGKTTFVNLISRLYDVNNGEILIDGIDVKQWDIDTLRKQIGYLIQDTFLFEDTILNNLRYNNPKVTEKIAKNIFKELGASEFINSLPDGINTVIRTDNGSISSGQQQIIALARILLRNPKILILDEATSKIDTKSEKMIQRAIETACKDKTTFIIAHRLSTIFNADLIILIQENRILEKGTHEELIKKGGVYAEIYSAFVGEK